MSASAVPPDQSGIACSGAGAINRLSVVTQASRRTAKKTKLQSCKNTVEFEPLPKLVADMDGAAFTMPLGGDARRVDFDQSGAASVAATKK